MKRGQLLWILALLLTLTSVVWQRLSGPTHPVRVRTEIGAAAVRGKLLRTHSTGGDLPVTVSVTETGAEEAGTEVGGDLVWRRFPTDDDWLRIPLSRTGDELTAAIPAQPSAGKVEYRVELVRGETTVVLPADRAVVARFKNDVPVMVLALHILAIFLAMLWSSRAGLEAIVQGPALRTQALTTFVLIVVGGLILGPIIQKYAFGAFWTGWPLGEDLTDNKLALAALAWLNALVQIRSGRGGRWAVMAAAVITLVIFAIPHSVRGSTLDYESMQTVTG